MIMIKVLKAYVNVLQSVLHRSIKLLPVQAMKIYMVKTGVALLILSSGTRWR